MPDIKASEGQPVRFVEQKGSVLIINDLQICN